MTLGAWLVAAAAITAITLPVLCARFELARRSPERVRFVIGALDGAVLGAVGLVLQDMASITLGVRIGLAGVLAASGLVAGVVAQRFPRFVPGAAWLGALAALAFAEWLPPRALPWLRLALDVFAAGALTLAFAPLLARVPSRVLAPRSVAIATLLLVSGGYLTLTRSARARSFTYDYAPHAQASLALLPLEDSHGKLGGIPCKRSVLRAKKTPKSVFTGVAKGADVLLLSLDALRYDRLHALPLLAKELGPHVTFTRAVAPAPRTISSLSAILRGVPARQVLLDGRPPHEVVSLHAPPTIARVLRKHAYRALQVPTNHYFDPRKGINRGFELVKPKPKRDGKRSVEFPNLRASDAFRLALGAIAQQAKQPEPLLLWIHLMEGHDPYKSDHGSGPRNSEGQLRAFRDVDRRAAQFVATLKAQRPGRRFIVVVFGDHGEEFLEHGGRFHSSSVYAEQVRAALMLAAPGLPNATIDAPVSHSALPATLLDLLGLPPASTFTEPSLLPCVASRAACTEVAVSEMRAFGHSIGYTFEHHRLIVDPEHDVQRLFDSRVDPFEKNDIAGDDPQLMPQLEAIARRFDRQRCMPKPPPQRSR